MSQNCFADEIAIDFPSVEPAVERMRDAFLGEPADEAECVLRREVTVSRREAWDGVFVPIDVSIHALCSRCGGRGEVWTELCTDCHSTGASLLHHAVRLPVPPGVADGACFRFRVAYPGARPVRVEVRIAISDRVVE